MRLVPVRPILSILAIFGTVLAVPVAEKRADLVGDLRARAAPETIVKLPTTRLIPMKTTIIVKEPSVVPATKLVISLPPLQNPDTAPPIPTTVSADLPQNANGGNPVGPVLSLTEGTSSSASPMSQITTAAKPPATTPSTNENPLAAAAIAGIIAACLVILMPLGWFCLHRCFKKPSTEPLESRPTSQTRGYASSDEIRLISPPSPLCSSSKSRLTFVPPVFGESVGNRSSMNASIVEFGATVESIYKEAVESQVGRTSAKQSELYRKERMNGKRRTSLSVSDVRKAVPDLSHIDTSKIANTIRNLNPFKDSLTTLPRYSRPTRSRSDQEDVTVRSPLYDSNIQRYQSTSPKPTTKTSGSSFNVKQSVQTLCDSRETLPEYTILSNSKNYGSTSSRPLPPPPLPSRNRNPSSNRNPLLDKIGTKLNFNDPRDLSARSLANISSRSCMVDVSEDEEANESGVRWKGKGLRVNSIHRDNHGAGREDIRSSADRLGNVTALFQRNGGVVETEAWIQRAQAASMSEMLFYIVVIMGSGLGFLLVLKLLEWLFFGSASKPTPPPTTPPTTPPVVPPGTPAPPGWPAGYPWPPPYCPAPNTGYMAPLPLWVVQIVQLFVTLVLVTIVATRAMKWWDKRFMGTRYDLNEDDLRKTNREVMKSTVSPQTTRGSSFFTPARRGTPTNSLTRRLSADYRSDSDVSERSPLVNSAALSSVRYTSSYRNDNLSRSFSEQTLNGSSTPQGRQPTRNYGSIDSILTRTSTAATGGKSDLENAKEYYAKIFSTNFPKKSTASSSRLIELDGDGDEELEEARTENDKPQRVSTTPFLDEQIGHVNEAIGGVIDRIMGRKDGLNRMRVQSDRLDGVTQMFRRNGEVAETEAWVQKVKATSFVELMYFMVVVLGSGQLLLTYLPERSIMKLTST
ncbi:UNVERIFIED_CONTAM: hypothetical protein HDU68_012788 [Siphonaria sp. JEL0065]|nr:hypothetical protein HDU68_012788 [Siphonaria sp. JEL0065]